MKIRCNREHLADRLAQAARAASTRANLQSAAHVRLTAESSEVPVELAATDLEMTLRVPLDADVEQGGSVLLPAKIAPELIRALNGETVELSAEADGRVLVSSGSSSYTLYGLPVDEFPQLPEIDHEQVFETDSAVFGDVVGRIKRAASRDESRPVLTGALVRFESDRITMAATDSYRLAVAEAPLTKAPPEALEAIIPIKALEEVVRIAGADGALSVAIGEGLVTFGIGGIWLSVRRIEGQFPNFTALKPDGVEQSATIAKDELLEVVRRVGIVVRQNTPVRVELAPGQLSLQARTADVAEGAESIPVAATGTETIEIGFNHEFLRDGIESVPGDEVKLSLISSLRPALLESVDGTFWYVIMPIRI
ncbi:MAG: DNA polymerase III subunit beta [Actinobacteria bacterium]|jgi:DNA polymerase-3 subunit beta|nr:DNA polymerase III subunit beta [Actinomycetota bacterium]